MNRFKKNNSILQNNVKKEDKGRIPLIIKIFIIFIFLYFLFSAFYFLKPARAEKIEELKTQINQKNQEMESIQKEIEEYKVKIRETTKDANNLKNQLKTLENTLFKIKADIKFSQNRIEAANLSIEGLSLGIGDTNNKINKNRGVISETIRLINEADSQSLVEILLANNNLSDFFDNLNSIENFEENIALNLEGLRELKIILEEQKDGVQTEKENLETRKEELVDKQKIQTNTQKQKEELLKQTKNKESSYKSRLKERLKKQEALEKEISAIEEELRVAIDPESLPKAGSGVLSWPLDEITITQYFGNTAFATKNPQIYGGKGHNGVDFRASIGSSVKAGADGLVRDIGDTDIACDGVSYGKWVLVDHSNNLSTLYAHLSLIKVKNGDKIEKNQAIGYSGATGYVTGPHLHFTVFASKAVKVDTMKSKVCGTIMTLPLAPYNAYLNPLSYL